MWKSTAFSYDELPEQVPAKELSALLEVSSALSSSLELEEVLQIAIGSAADLLGLETGAIYVLENDLLYLGATVPPLLEHFPGELRQAILKDHPHIYEAIYSQSPVYLRDARSATLSLAEQVVVEARHLVSVLYFPLFLKEQPIGAFIVGTTDEIREFSKTDIILCKILSGQASLAVTNARLYEQSQQAMLNITRAYDATLEGWTQVLDLRDHATDQHTHRVADLTVSLASRFGFSNSHMEHIRRGALLHDIGKMAIPDAILQKPGRLSDSEWEIMKTHPGVAYELLSHIDYLTPALDIPYCHHEKWDGSGYPRRLRGDEIPMTARIFAVVDVFDAITSDRPYRKAWTVKDALAYIFEQSGKHFYPDVVKVFLEMEGAQF